LFYLFETSSPTCYQDHVKISFQTGKGKKPENILYFGEKAGKYPDFGEKPENIWILHKNSYLRKGNIQEKSQI
jgi:hypothetical protein